MLMLALVISGCGAPSSGGQSDPADLAESDQVLVAFEAEWLCEVTRHAYADLSAMDEARAALMGSYGVVDSAYADFKHRLAADAELRHHVSTAHTSACA